MCFLRPFLPSLVFVGLFVFPLSGDTLAFGYREYGRPTPATAGIFEIGLRNSGVPGTFPTKFGIYRPFRFLFMWRHETDRQTNGQDQQ